MKKILIVDDEPDALKMVTLTLQAEGYQVVTGSDGEEALRLAQAEHPDLIMLDVMMPKLNGYEVARRLRRLPEFSQVPILFLSARGQVEGMPGTERVAVELRHLVGLVHRLQRREAGAGAEVGAQADDCVGEEGVQRAKISQAEKTCQQT